MGGGKRGKGGKGKGGASKPSSAKPSSAASAPRIESSTDYKLKLLSRDEDNQEEKARRAEERRQEAERRKKAAENGRPETWKDHQLEKLDSKTRRELRMQADNDWLCKTSSRPALIAQPEAPSKRGGYERERLAPPRAMSDARNLAWGSTPPTYTSSSDAWGSTQPTYTSSSSDAWAQPTYTSSSSNDWGSGWKESKDWNGWSGSWGGGGDQDAWKREEEKPKQPDRTDQAFRFAIGDHVRVKARFKLEFPDDDGIITDVLWGGDRGVVNERMHDSNGESYDVRWDKYDGDLLVVQWNEIELCPADEITEEKAPPYPSKPLPQMDIRCTPLLSDPRLAPPDPRYTPMQSDPRSNPSDPRCTPLLSDPRCMPTDPRPTPLLSDPRSAPPNPKCSTPLLSDPRSAPLLCDPRSAPPNQSHLCDPKFQPPPNLSLSDSLNQPATVSALPDPIFRPPPNLSLPESSPPPVQHPSPPDSQPMEPRREFCPVQSKAPETTASRPPDPSPPKRPPPMRKKVEDPNRPLPPPIPGASAPASPSLTSMPHSSCTPRSTAISDTGDHHDATMFAVRRSQTSTPQEERIPLSDSSETSRPSHQSLRSLMDMEKNKLQQIREWGNKWKT